MYISIAKGYCVRYVGILCACIFLSVSFFADVANAANEASLASMLEGWLPSWLFFTLSGYGLWQWIAAIAGFFLVYVSRWVFRRLLSFVVKFSSVSFADWHQRILNLISKEVSAVASWVVFYLYIGVLGFSLQVMQHVSTAVKIVVALYVFRALYKLVDMMPEVFVFFEKTSNVKLEKPLVDMMEKIVKVFVVLVVPLVIIQNLGVNVASILAGLGLGGLAFALAAKDTLSNLFGSLMILLDKPFSVGDWVIMAGQEGTVCEIGLRSTRLRTFYDSVLSIPNSQVISSNIDNMGKRGYRRIKTTLSLNYHTQPKTIQMFLSKVRTYLNNHSHTRADGEHHVVLSKFSESSLDVMLYFFIDVKDWTQELHVREEIFLHIIEMASNLGVSFAFPTRSIHLEPYQHEQTPWLAKSSATESTSV